MTIKRSQGGYAGLITGLLLVLLLLALVACGDQGSESPAPPAESPVEATPAGEAATRPAQATETPPAPTTAPTATESESEPATITPAATVEAPVPETEPTATPAPAESQVSAVNLAQVASGFNRPLYLTHAYDERLFVVEQDGQVKIIAGGQTAPEPFLDISDRVGATALEQGLLSIAFHPQFQANGRFFVNYTDLQGDTVVAEYSLDPADPNRADPGSERVLFSVNQPYGNHNGGQLQFGPDGYLYVGMGDGGSAGDPLNQGQDASTLLGALLRLDVDNADPAGELPYAIPADNPFAGQDGGRGEVWAFGLRNPWRFSFDRQTGDFYLSDVGQNVWEEINFQMAGAGGGANYGWNVMEASNCYASDDCDPSAFELPVAEYRHEGGHCSVTGGYIYRGSSYPALSGNYFFADYCSGTLWSLFPGDDGSWQQLELQRTGLIISSFGEDWRGELYIIDHMNGGIYQLQA